MSPDFAQNFVLNRCKCMTKSNKKSDKQQHDMCCATYLSPLVYKYMNLKPWFDAECVKAKNDLQKILEQCKKLNYPEPLSKLYSSEKKKITET